MSNNKHFADLLKVCSILPALAIMPAMSEEITTKVAITAMHDEQNSGNHFVGAADGSLFNVRPGGELEISGATFADNSLDSEGDVDWGYGLIFNKGDMTVSGATFVNNSATAGGAIASSLSANSGNISGTTFKNNHAWLDGGAIASFGPLNILNSLFEGNTAQYTYDEESKTWSVISTGDETPMGGGAIAFGAVSDSSIASVAGTTFKNNKSGLHGGAIATRLAEDADNSLARLDIAATFDGNFAETNGGAIYNSFYADNGLKKGEGVTVTGAFNNNSAGVAGGAIYNDGAKDSKGNGAVMTIYNAEFEKNVAGVAGGAIYNTGTLVIVDSEVSGNKTSSGLGDGGAIYSDGSLTITNTDFSDNYAKEDVEEDCGYGGAIFAKGTVDIQGGEFENNHALTAGAIYTSKSAQSVNISNVEFESNWASDIGALGVFGKNVSLKNLRFESNYTTGAFKGFNDGAGALFFGAEAQAFVENSSFISNKSAGVGGAIAMRSTDLGNNKDAKLDIINSSFSGNIATTNGGAIYSTFYNSETAVDNVYVAKTSFVNNKATNGGAIYNDGLADRGKNYASIKLEDLTFVNNIASDKGGAIYNGEGATANLSGNNTFSGNTAGKGANDIYNDGALNITGGTTVISGGVLGNGTLTLAQGATLDIGNSTIHQDVLNIDGIVKASVLSNRSYGRLLADNKLLVGENAELHLSVGTVGEYDMFGAKSAGFKTITYGNSYIVTELENGVVKVETKTVEQLVASTGLTTQAAGVVAGLANSHDDGLRQISLAAQQALNSGNAELVERESKKLNPETKPVAQSIASSVQNQVLSLAAGRMSGAIATGRAGGDTSQENGFWMHGLFNKSKMDGQFHGYTRGVAFGMDTVIDGKYTLGGGLAFNNSDVHSSGRGHTDIDSKTLFMYGQYKPNNWFANIALTYSMAEYDEETTPFGVVKINNVYDVDTYGAQIMTGYDFASGVTTEAGVRYLHIAQDAYANTSATDTDFLTGVAGLKYAFSIENDWAINLKPELRAALTYDLISEADAAVIDMPGVASYRVQGESLKRFGGEFGIGLTADYKGLKVSLMYDLDLHKDYTSQTGMIKLRTQF